MTYAPQRAVLLYNCSLGFQLQLVPIEYKITFSTKIKSNFYTSSKTLLESCAQRDIFISNITLSLILFFDKVTKWIDTINNLTEVIPMRYELLNNKTM